MTHVVHGVVDGFDVGEAGKTDDKKSEQGSKANLRQPGR
jgi:hypothetical protein